MDDTAKVLEVKMKKGKETPKKFRYEPADDLPGIGIAVYVEKWLAKRVGDEFLLKIELPKDALKI